MGLVIEKSKLVSKIFFGVFWIATIIPFFGQELMPNLYFTISSPLFALFDIIVAILGLWLLKDKTDKLTLILFAGFAFISSCIFNDQSIIQFINGLRLYTCYLFIAPIYRYLFDNEERRNKFVKKMDKALYIFLWLQLPTAAIQCYLYGAYDNVGGTFGWMMSGEMSTLVYLISFYLMHRKWDETKSYMQNVRSNWILIFLLTPSFLNETKISFVYLLMYFFFLLPMDKQFIKRLLIFIPAMIVTFGFAGYFYLTMTGSDTEIFTEEYISMYLSGDEDALSYMEFMVENGEDEGEGSDRDLFRGVKFAAIPFLQMREPHVAAVGFGVGQFKGGTSLEKTEFAKEFEWLLTGVAMGFYVYIIELGYIGLAGILIFWFVIFNFSKRKNQKSQLLTYQVIIVIILGLYNAAFIYLPFVLIFMYILFANRNWRQLQTPN